MSPERISPQPTSTVEDDPINRMYSRKEIAELMKQARALESDDSVVEQSVTSVESEPNNYDRLFDANYESPTNVEDAAVRPQESEGDRLTRERREADARAAVSDAYLMNKDIK